MRKLQLMSDILAYLGRPIIRIYIRNNRLMFKLLCFIVLSIDYQLFTKVLSYAVKAIGSRRQ
jgi:hypothetical protein